MNFDTIKQNCISCTKCGLNKTRTNVVFGTGNPCAKILFVGEAPGKNEDEQGLPFIGRSGQLLDKLLSTVGLYREKNIYITNIVKCRPPQNRDPMPEEWDACEPHLQSQIKIMKPKIIVCLGRIAAQKIISKDLRIMKEHGVFFENNGTLFMATLHPAALLRNPSNKPLALEDYAMLRRKAEELGIEI